MSVQDDSEVANIIQYDISEDFQLKKGNIQAYQFNDIDFLSEKEFEDIASDYTSHLLIWDEIRTVIDPTHLAMVTSFEITTDGLDGILASVYLYNIRNNDWRISIDIMDHVSNESIRRKYFAETLVHEYGHLISLNRTQMTGDTRSINTFETDEGITKEDSYMNVYFQRFWKEIYNQVNDHDFYELRRKEFLNNYAATNPVEDFAETFVYFIFSDYPEDETVLSKKVQFFYEYEEIVEMRKRIRDIYKDDFETY